MSADPGVELLEIRVKVVDLIEDVAGRSSHGHCSQGGEDESAEIHFDSVEFRDALFGEIEVEEAEAEDES